MLTSPLNNYQFEPPKVVKQVKKEVPFRDKEIKCLADNIYYEASHEPIQGKIAVANVTLNRVRNKHFPDTVCRVVYQKYQFSWTRGVKKKFNAKEYRSAMKIAIKAYSKKLKDNTFGSTHFHAGHIIWPDWSEKLNYTVSYGNHVFYKM